MSHRSNPGPRYLRLHRTEVPLITFIAVACLGLAAIGVWGWSAPAAIGTTPRLTLPLAAGAPQHAPAQEKIEAELITVRPYGFEPAEIRRPHGDFLLVIDNRSRQANISVQLHRLQGNRPADKLKEVPMPKGRVNWLDRFNLPPGDYLLTEANHPQWSCRLTLTPR